MSPIPQGKHSNCSFPNDPSCTTPNPSQATKPTTQANQSSRSNSSSTAASQAAHNRLTPANLPAPFPTLHISPAHPAPPSRPPSPPTPSRTATAWETHVLAQEQKRYSQRLRFALQTQYRHIRNSNLETDLQSALRTHRFKNTQTMRSVGAGDGWRGRDAVFDEYPFAWDRVEARRLEEQWRGRRGQLDGVFNRGRTGASAGGW